MKKAFLISAVALLSAASGANSATFNLIDYTGTVAGTQAQQGFKIATDYWASVLTSNVTINLRVGYSALAQDVIGSTGSTRATTSTASIYQQLATTGNSALDASAVASLTPLTSAGGLNFLTSGYANSTTKTGVDVTKQVYDNDNTANNTQITANTAVLKALGYTINSAYDATVNFSSAFAFDFNPTDGIDADKIDFIGVAIHEIGHALGFTSGVDSYDTGNATTFSGNTAARFSTLDLFRYSSDPSDLVPGAGPVHDLSVGGTPYFSIDGGNTQLFGDSLFSTGANRGDGRQASHWKDGEGDTRCGPQIGILDPTFCYGQTGEVTALDLAAYDAMGWNVGFDVLQNPGYRQSTAAIYQQFAAAVPEAGTWAQMVLGFGLLGGAIRLRNRRSALVTA